MAQINLLKQTETGQRSWEMVPKILARVFLLVLILLVVYYCWIIFASSQVQKESVEVQKNINDNRQAALNMEKRDEALTRQLQLKTLDSEISGHIYFSQLLPELANVTLKKASYTSLQTTADGNLVLVAAVPTVSDFEKYLQVFDLLAFNKYFSNIRVGGFHKTFGENGAPPNVTFSLKMDYDPSLLQYKSGK